MTREAAQMGSGLAIMPVAGHPGGRVRAALVSAVTAAMLAGTTRGGAGPAAPNLVRNPSCEATAAEGRPAEWLYSYSSGGPCDFVVDSQTRYEGRGSIKLSNRPDGAQYPRMFQSLELEADTRYVLSAWVLSTTGLANLQVTPGGGTWFGAGDYGGGVDIAAGEEWQRIAKEVTTTAAAKVNVVFTLTTENRQPAELWVDNVSLVKAGPRPDPSRFIPPVDTTVVLPHVTWAKDLPGPRRRILLMAPQITIRDVIELAQRMEVDATIRYAPREGGAASSDLLKLLAEPWDAFVLGSVNWERLPPPVREVVWEKVRAGTGLLLVKPLSADGELKGVLETLQPASTRAFYSREQQIDLPYLSWVRQGAGLRVGSLDRGRVAVID